MTSVQVGNLKIRSESYHGLWRICVEGPKEELRFCNPDDDEAKADAKAAILADMIRTHASGEWKP